MVFSVRVYGSNMTISEKKLPNIYPTTSQITHTTEATQFCSSFAKQKRPYSSLSRVDVVFVSMCSRVAGEHNPRSSINRTRHCRSLVLDGSADG